eukprot:XP_001700960.1 predicted protein [Chlamydomonas reinhardtii]
MTAAAPTPDPKTTGRRGRRGAAAAAEQSAPALEKQLFQDEPVTEQQAQQEDVPVPEPSLEQPAPESSEQEQQSSEPADQASADPDSDKESHELHTDSHVLMASPIPMALPVPIAADNTAAAEEMQPLQLNLDAAAPAPAVAPRPAPAPQPSPLQAAAQPPASPMPIPMSPMALEMQPAPSPAPVAANAAASPMPAGTPLSFTSDLGAAPGQPGGLSMPATPLSFNSMADAVDAAEFSPMPDDDEMGGGSPISLSGDPVIATPAPMQQQDADMADNATPAGNMALQPAAVEENPMTFASDRPLTPMADPSPMAGFLGMAPASVPHPAAAVQARLSEPAAGFVGFSPLPMHVAGTDAQVESPSLDGLIVPAAAAAGASPSPFSLTPPMPPLGQLQDITFSPLPGTAVTPIAGLAPVQPAASPMGAVLPVPAPTPEGAAAPGYALALTPLAGAIAEMQPAAAEEEDEMAMEEDCDMNGAPMCEEPAASTPLAAPTPAAAASKTPAAATPGARMFTPKLVSTASKATPQAKTPTMVSAKSPYVNVESRYNKPRTPAAVTPVAPVAAATTKSIKRVSITTPEGPRSTAPQRQVVPTPYRPKSAAAEAPSPLPIAEPTEEVQQQQQAPVLAPEAAAAAEERRAKAAERLKSIHDAETGAASVPSYLAPTQAFANKAAGKALKSKVEAGDYDPRSLRQLKREVKEAMAKKAEKAGGASSLTAPRDVKLTPKVAERDLAMPDDQEDSDHEAEYNEAQENVLVEAMGGLEVAPPASKAMPLRGLPAPQGRHLRFDDKGKAAESPQRTVLRGLPVASGKYKRFE